MYRSETAIVTGPESGMCHDTVSALGRAGMDVRRAARSAEVHAIAATLVTFDVLITLPRYPGSSAGPGEVNRGAAEISSEIDHLLRCLQPAIRHMADSGRGGRVVHVVPAALEFCPLTGALAAELADAGIAVNSVVLGPEVTDAEACETIAFLAGSPAAGQTSGAEYVLVGHSMSVRGPGQSPTRGERYLSKSLRSRLRALHADHDC
ncbi:hypothetical protein [Rhodococcus sp. NPDC058521]|uniref:hypothetical protein n=1 Tax=Rhodococcus sp. NPDC058521 TaxID=3346536 RepID=UPI003655D2AB